MQRILIVTILLAAWPNQPLKAGQPPAFQRPNVLFILADDLGYGDLSCYGATKVSTPNIDRLAAEGRRFTDAHSPSSVCTPSRYNLLSGRYAWRTWAKTGTVWANDPLLIEEDRFTLADLFKQQGYATAGIGKWHLGFGKPDIPGWDRVLGPDYNRELKPGPLEVGFDYYWGFPHVGQKPHVIIENHRVLGLRGEDPLRILPDPRPSYDQDYLHRPRVGREGVARLEVEGGRQAWYQHEDLAIMLTERAVQYIEDQSGDQPFFLYLAHRNIHGPHIPAKRFEGQSSIGEYGDFLLELDWSVGQVLDALDNKGFTDNTLVIFTSDNGAVVTYGPVDRAEVNGHYVNGPLRGQKTDAYEGGHRVPFIARWPGQVRPGSESSAMIALTDVLATFADYFGQPLRSTAGEDSFSFLGALLDQPPRQITRQAMVNDSCTEVFAIRKGDWKLILSQTGGNIGDTRAHDPSQPPGQLYHLGRDPAESKNEYARRPALVAELSRLLKTYQDSGRSAPVARAN